MLIKKRWAWLTSVILLGFLAQADGHEDDSSLSVVEPVMKNDPFPKPVINIIEECTKHEDPRTKFVSIEDKLAPLKTYVEPKGDTEVLPEKNKLTEQHGFPYAINSPPSITQVSAMLSYCVYDESHSTKGCEEFLDKNCDKDALHHFKLAPLNLNAVTVCKNEDRVYVAFAGTQSLSDNVVNARVFSRRINFSKKNLYGHGGHVERSKQYSGWVTDKLRSIQGIDQKEIILTGHSLGAAQATLLAHDVYEGLGLDIRGGVSNSLNQVKVIGFASPSTLLDPTSYFLGHLNHIRFYNPNDPVATTLSSWSRYGHVGVQIATQDKSTQHIARAVPLLKKEDSLRLLHTLPVSYWKSLPPLARSRFNPGLYAHSIDSYTLLAAPEFADYQEERDVTDRSVTSPINAEKVLSKRIGAPVTCNLQNNKVICISGNTIIAKFRYALDAPSVGQKADICMSNIVYTNFVPGVTVNAGISIENNMSPITAASEALILDISLEDRWYEQMPSKMFAALYLDGNSPLPDICDRKPILLEPAKTLPTERNLISKSINAPTLFSVTKNHVVPVNETVDRIQDDYEFFSNVKQEGWMDCRLPENYSFCPAHCMDNQICAVMKKWDSDGKGANYWVSLNKSSNLKWGNDDNSWKYTITEKSTSWFSIWSTQNQATFMVVRDAREEYLQFSN